jgi:hypothetical protein
MSRALTLDEAASELRKTPRWLKEWLAKHPVDATGTPFYVPLGRTKTFEIQTYRPDPGSYSGERAMPLEIYRRGGVWHCRGTVGPDGRRMRIRQSLHTKNKDTAARQAAEIEKKYWDGHFDGPAAILTFAAAHEFTGTLGSRTPFWLPSKSIWGIRWCATSQRPPSKRWPRILPRGDGRQPQSARPGSSQISDQSRVP